MSQREKKACQAWFDEPEIAQIDHWRRRQAVIPTIAEAMRVLVKRGLAAENGGEERGQAA
ncbi:hypothetical protein V1283_003788 [Bradyrhizobium sp. AZCC 2262]|uniref:hypothetical protein n=1 Tax=Bradyrhizobium sp. AZCC 2262 TaxID=3117022 RepID=UPI002FEFB48D